MILRIHPQIDLMLRGPDAYWFFFNLLLLFIWLLYSFSESSLLDWWRILPIGWKWSYFNSFNMQGLLSGLVWWRKLLNESQENLMNLSVRPATLINNIACSGLVTILLWRGLKVGSFSKRPCQRILSFFITGWRFWRSSRWIWLLNLNFMNTYKTSSW